MIHPNAWTIPLRSWSRFESISGTNFSQEKPEKPRPVYFLFTRNLWVGLLLTSRFIYEMMYRSKGCNDPNRRQKLWALSDQHLIGWRYAPGKSSATYRTKQRGAERSPSVSLKLRERIINYFTCCSALPRAFSLPDATSRTHRIWSASKKSEEESRSGSWRTLLATA